MTRRARSLTVRLRHSISGRSRIADIGSGTGHNAANWRSEFGATVDEFDVVDLHWVGAGPVLYDGNTLPSSDRSYDVCTLLFVLQYVQSPLRLLTEVRRTCSDRVLVMQSTYRGRWGRCCLAIRGFLWGRFAFYVARLARVIRHQPCPLDPRTAFTREQLRQLFDRAGYRVHSWESREWHCLNISRDLIVLEANPQSP